MVLPVLKKNSGYVLLNDRTQFIFCWSGGAGWSLFVPPDDRGLLLLVETCKIYERVLLFLEDVKNCTPSLSTLQCCVVPGLQAEFCSADDWQEWNCSRHWDRERGHYARTSRLASSLIITSPVQLHQTRSIANCTRHSTTPRTLVNGEWRRRGRLMRAGLGCVECVLLEYRQCCSCPLQQSLHCSHLSSPGTLVCGHDHDHCVTLTCVKYFTISSLSSPASSIISILQKLRSYLDETFQVYQNL